ncbi:Uncharacterized protein PECH_006563 [Penicillium ucsense]|uniref:Uncharacterized protein n=1 Tax=Penicillium ucsense TaxID=2839758 RepID=A0A8J8W696_9EURO|nr:Uncharacterized protein PECM_006021 [Penicillium ucsense]KAF7735556.1 Uncharacterized protein PECH_006563 [Penicillium ucsense]
MAQRSNDHDHSVREAQSSNHILSPQPSSHLMKESLVQSLETAHIPSCTEVALHENQGYAMRSDDGHSSSSSNRHSAGDLYEYAMGDELANIHSRASSRSSISSIPASVLIHPVHQLKELAGSGPLKQTTAYTVEEDEAEFGGFDRSPQSMRTIRQREAAFRKPSSVRAMQMYTEDEAEEDDYLTPPRRHQGIRSPGTSYPKRSTAYPQKNTHPKPSSKKEYPLVLLHCTLLAPSLPVPGAADPQNQRLVEEVLPPQYWKRWRRLQDKIGSGVLRERGVLISHPEDLYDVLEERLLESLELQRPLVHRGHFLGHEKADVGSDGEASDRSESETDGEQGDECPDCGRHVLHQSDINRKWEIRVYAANGLMRAGAWAAAWKEMEKVDVEVGVWLPSELRRALEKRLKEERAAVALQLPETPFTLSDRATPRMEMFQTPFHIQPNMLRNANSVASDGLRSTSQQTESRPVEPERKANNEIALQTLLVNYIRVLAADRRNVALVVMSVLIAFLAIGSRSRDDRLIDVLHSVPQDKSFEHSILAKMGADTGTAILPPRTADVSIVEDVIPASSVILSVHVTDIPVQSYAARTFAHHSAVPSEPISLIPKPTLEAEAPKVARLVVNKDFTAFEKAAVAENPIDPMPSAEFVVNTEPPESKDDVLEAVESVQPVGAVESSLRDPVVGTKPTDDDGTVITPDSERLGQHAVIDNLPEPTENAEPVSIDEPANLTNDSSISESATATEPVATTSIDGNEAQISSESEGTLPISDINNPDAKVTSTPSPSVSAHLSSPDERADLDDGICFWHFPNVMNQASSESKCATSESHNNENEPVSFWVLAEDSDTKQTQGHEM